MTKEELNGGQKKHRFREKMSIKMTAQWMQSYANEVGACVTFTSHLHIYANVNEIPNIINIFLTL